MNWSDITLRQWYNLQKVNDYEDILDKRLAMIAAVTDSTFDEVEGLKMSEINKLAKEYEFLNTPIKTKVVTGWKDYKFVVKLSDLTAGQMIDFLETAKEDIENKLHVLLAIMDTGSKKDFEAKQKELLECPITIVQGISNFFFRKYNLSPQAIQDYSLKKLKEMNQIVQKMSQELQEIL